MKKRVFLVALPALLFAIGLSAEAQQVKKIPRVGFLDPTTRAVSIARIEAFRQGLRKLGYVEDKNITLDFRFADGNSQKLDDLANELIRLDANVIVVRAIPGAVAAKRATATIPIVFVGLADAVAAGLVRSLANPGGNITGLTSLAPELSGKRLELLKEAFPKLSRVAVLHNPSNSGDTLIWKETLSAAQGLGLQVHSIEVRTAKDLPNALESALSASVDAFLTFPDPLLQSHRKAITDFVAKTRLPGVYPDSEYVEGGGLISYAANAIDFYVRAATYVDRILKGAKPRDLPVEQPTKFELVVNLKTAKLIGVSIPSDVLARADRVIN